MNSDPRAADPVQRRVEGIVGWRPFIPLFALWVALSLVVVPVAGQLWPEDGTRASALAAAIGLICTTIGYALVATTANRSAHLFFAGVVGSMFARLVVVCAAVFLVQRQSEELGITDPVHFSICLLTFVLALMFAEAAILARAIARPAST